MTFEKFARICYRNELPSGDFDVSWSLGGTSGSCWSDELTTISPSNPKELTEFDKLVEFWKPDMSFIQYKALKNAVVTKSTYEEGDWYGGCETYAKISCDFRKLYDYMEERGWLKEPS